MSTLREDHLDDPNKTTDEAPGFDRRAATSLLRSVVDGESGAADALLPLLFDELHGLAAGYLRRERRDHTLQPTALVHEAYLRLIDRSGVNDGDREHFLALAAQAMRRVLVEHARARKRDKRGGDAWSRVTLSPELTPSGGASLDPIELDDLIGRLGEVDERMAKVVELRFFAGLGIQECARVLGVSPRTVDNDWFCARGWLSRELEGQGRS